MLNTKALPFMSFPWESIKGRAFFVAQLGLEPRFKV